MLLGDGFAVLVVDDDLDIRETLREILEAEGFPVITAANGAEAMEVLAKEPRPGLIVLDLMMPVMSGWELLAAMRAERGLAEIPVAVISASGGANAPSGATYFLRKPIDLGTLLALVWEHCEGPHPPISGARCVPARRGFGEPERASGF